MHIQTLLPVLEKAADRFVKNVNGQTEIWAASEDWFLEPWGRDTFISLPGLLLTTKRFEESRSVFRSFAAYEQGGIIPNRILPEKTLYNTVDASLWFLQALKQYLAHTEDVAFVREMMPTCRNIIEGYLRGTSYQHFGQDQWMRMDEDGLIISPAQATWMDADPSGDGASIVTPRDGKCVEINALWYSGLLFVTALEKKARCHRTVENHEKLLKKIKISFNRKFWNKEERCLLDVIEGDSHSGALRPNQIFAISHGEDLLSKTRQKQVFQSVTRDLLTPFGLRTLSPRDSHYIGHYETSDPMSVKDWAYHQGTVWPWLIGAYCDALVIVRKGQLKYNFAISDELQAALTPLLEYCLESENQSIPEVFSGDVPHLSGGTRSQAWSVAEVLRVLQKYDLFFDLSSLE